MCIFFAPLIHYETMKKWPMCTQAKLWNTWPNACNKCSLLPRGPVSSERVCLHNARHLCKSCKFWSRILMFCRYDAKHLGIWKYLDNWQTFYISSRCLASELNTSFLAKSVCDVKSSQYLLSRKKERFKAMYTMWSRSWKQKSYVCPSEGIQRETYGKV